MTHDKTHSSTRQGAPRRARHLTLALLAALLAVAGAQPAGGTADPVDRADPVVLRGCLLSGVSFPVSHDHAEAHVPRDYRAGTYGDDETGVVAIWVYDCEGVTAGREIGPAALSVVGVLLDDDTDLGEPTTWPNALAPAGAVDQPWAANWPQYVVWAHTDEPRLTAALRRMGLPATTVRHIALTERYLVEPVEQRVDLPDTDTCSRIGPAPGAAHSPPDDVRPTEPHKTTEVLVPWEAGRAYQTTTVLPSTPHNTVTHCHDQLLRHGTDDDASTVRVTIPVARDHFCSSPQPGCGWAAAAAESPVAGLLGDEERDDPVLAFDHERIPRVVIEPH